jgi:hypothetical protein
MEIFKPTEKAWIKPNKSIIFFGVILLLQIYQITNQTYSNYQLKKDPTLRAGEAAEDFCYYTVSSLISGNFSWRMFDEVTYKGLKAEPNYFDFKEDEKVKLVKVNGDQCRVLTESEGRLKGLLITLNKSLNNPLYYKAIQVNEEDEPNETAKN